MDRVLTVAHISDTSELTPDAWGRVVRVVGDLQAAGRCDVLLHAGDVNLSLPAGVANAAILNRLGIDAVALGNHDLDGGLAALRAQAARLRAPLLCANVAGGPEGWVRPYRLLRRRGWRIAVVGLTLPDFAAYQPERNVAGLAFEEPADALRRILSRLSGRADVIVVLSHCGYEPDRELMRRTIGVTLVVGGHSHVLLPEPVPVGYGWVAQAGADGTHVGWVELRRSGGRIGVCGGVIPTAGRSPDPYAVRLAQRARDPADEVVVGYAATDLRTPDDFRETPFGDLLVDLIRKRAGTEIALLRCAAISNSVGPGPLTRADLRRLNTNGADRIAVLTLTGAELLGLLECGAQEAYYLLTASGARVTYDFDRPLGQRVAEVHIAGQKLDPARRYTVACSEYLARGVAVYTPLRGSTFETLPVSADDVLAEHLAREGVLRPSVDGRLVVRGDRGLS
jgi:2',3'-cyclic-nucleotide 2'-phosphodiesterase (5'-nucleotidase family)